MALTDIAIRALKHGDKPIKKADEKGLFLLLQPSGGKLWRFKYRFNGKEKKLGFGRYPDVPLKEARRWRDEARQTLAMGIDPGEEKRQKAQDAAHNAANSFEVVGNDYLDKMCRDGREAVTIGKSRIDGNHRSGLASFLTDRQAQQVVGREVVGVGGQVFAPHQAVLTNHDLHLAPADADKEAVQSAFNPGDEIVDRMDSATAELQGVDAAVQVAPIGAVPDNKIVGHRVVLQTRQALPCGVI